MTDRKALLFQASQLYSEDQALELEAAIKFAEKAHDKQKRASGEAYIIHPMNVALTLMQWGLDIDSVLAGLLHDTVEDTSVTLDEIESSFGRDVAFIVDGVTKVSKTSASIRRGSGELPQTKDNLSKLLIAVGQDIRVILIKLADRLHNLRTLKYIPPEKQKRIAKESLDIYGPMADRLGMGQVRMEIEDLAFRYYDPKEYKRLEKIIAIKLGKSNKKLALIKKEVSEILGTYNFKFEISGRIKSIYSLHKKLVKYNGDIDEVYDLIALRIIVNKKEECYMVLGAIHNIYQPMLNRIKDYISAPKPNGYQSLHTTVITRHEQIVEFQIRTHEMHEYAERGLAASFHYNEQKVEKDYTAHGIASNLPSHLVWITELQEVVSKLKNGEKVPQKQLNIDLFKDRIFVYSPRGDIYDLPEGALPLDFAYLVHSDVARHAYSFKVNGKIHPFDKPLHNGDIVEVITKKMAMPRQSWRELVTTSHARNKLRGQLSGLGLKTASRLGHLIKRQPGNKK